MLPLKLTLQGLYAFPDRPQEIDFARLSEAQLFGIFGATGSGKSSILEAISFALYGETDRLKKTDRRNFNMLNLRANRLWIDFEFLGGQEEQDRYRFTAEIKRKKRDFEDTYPPRRSAYKFQSGDWQPIDVKEVQTILGLSYDNFRRTVIIPQGKFQEFLALGNTDRTRMLREIFRLDRFELFDRVKGLIQENQTRLTREETLLAQLAAVTPEARTELQGTLEQKQAEAAEARKKAADLSQQLRYFDAQKEVMVALGLRREALAQLKARAEDMEARAKRLKRIEEAQRHIEPLLIRKSQLDTELKANVRELTQTREALAKTRDDLKTASRTHAHIQEEYTQRESLRMLAEEYATLQSLLVLRGEVAKLETRLTNGDRKIAEAGELLAQTRKEEEDTEARLRALREASPDIQAILAAREWQNRMNTLQEQAAHIQQELDEVAASLEATQTTAEKQLEALGLASDLPARRWESEADARLQDLREQLSRAEKQVQQALLHERIRDLADHLEPGSPCPVCGATEHPNTFSGDAPTTPAVEPLNKALNQAVEARASLRELARTHQEKYQRQQAILARQQENRALMEAHTGAAPLSPKLLEARLAAAKQNQEAIQEAEAALVTAREKRENAEQSLEKLKNFRTGLQEQYTRQSADLEARLASLRQVRPEEYREATPETLESLRRDALARYESLGQLYERERQRMEKLTAQLNQLEGGNRKLQDQQEDLTRKEAQLVSETQTALKKTVFSNVEEAMEVLDEAPDTDAERLALEQFQQDMMRAEMALEQVEKEARGITYDAEAHASLKQKAEDLEQKIEQKLIETGSLQQEIGKLDKQLEEKKAIEIRHKALEHRAENLYLLRKLFMQSGFVNYVSGIYLRQLCQAANERFRKLTHNQLQLEPTPDNSFAVRDFLNGGQLRSHKTLSGGQIFQASLCLALALADQVQDRARSRQRFFFIDEGFGSLDKQSLRLVFEALRALRQENRIVGVISHVEDMQEDIDTYLRITNRGEQGSRVETSW